MNPFEFDMALTEPVFDMIQRGVRIDRKARLELHNRYHLEWNELQTTYNRILGRPINVFSPKVMKEVLYEELRVPPRMKMGKPTTDERALRAIWANAEADYRLGKQTDRNLRVIAVCKLGLKIRSKRTRLSRYIDVAIDEDGRMRTILSVGATETGRFSASKTPWGTGCNMQTIPRELRLMFVPDRGKVMIELDLKAGETWVYAHLADEPTMIEILTTGKDFHKHTAFAMARVFGSPMTEERWEALSDQERYKRRFLAKKGNHALGYRMGAHEFQQVINEESDDTGIVVTRTQAAEMREAWIEEYWKMPQWWRSLEAELNTNNRVLTTPFGRIRTFYERWGDALFKEATAFKPQSTSVDYIDRGLLRIYQELVKRDFEGLEILHQNHDSLLMQCNEGREDRVIPECVSRIEVPFQCGDYEITIPVEAQVGYNWGPRGKDGSNPDGLREASERLDGGIRALDTSAERGA